MDIPSILLVFFSWVPHTLQCLSGEWRCNNRRCIDLERRCNGWDSCGDSSDERNCDRWRCPGGGKWWQCAGKQCIPSRKRCDGNLPGLEDCQDGSDEKNCDRWRCPGEYKWWQCAGKQCIPPRKRCDGLEDCQDGSDEKNCGRLYNGHLTILPSRVVIKGAKEEVTLTCYVSDVYSKQADYFVWSVGACRNRSAGNTCTFTLDAASDALLNVTCTALRINGKNEVVASGSKSQQLIISYPPQHMPVIQTQTPSVDGYLVPGDVLTCTVRGGQPLVSSVHFFCTHPVLPDGDDTTTTTAVSSSVTVRASLDDAGTAMTCLCIANWSLRPRYYTMSASVVYTIGHPPQHMPVIQTQTPSVDGYLVPGDVLTCTVRGGQPLVTSVHFFCTHPVLPDGDDTTTTTAVSSSVTVRASLDDAGSAMTCLCNAVWSVRPQYYTMTASVVYTIGRRLYDGHLTIHASHVVLKRAKDEVTLTCNVSDVYSKPDYFVWSVGACRNRSAGNTCTFTLDAASDALLNVTCTALRINGRNEVVASGSKTVRLNVTGRLYDGHLTILPSRVVIKGAKEEVTLTCNVSDVYSKPDYFVWSVGACRNRSAGNTCTFTLDAASDALLNVTCTALRINGRNEVVASGSKTVRLNVTYITALVGETPLQWKLLERSDVVSGIVLLVIAIAVVIAVDITRRKCSRKRRKTTDSTPGNRSSGWYEEIPELPEIQREQGPSLRATDNPTYIFPPLSDAVEVTHPLPHSPDHLMDRPLPDAVDPTHPLPHSPDHMKDRPLPALPGVAVQAAVDEITEQRHPPCDHAEGGSLPYAAMSLASSLPHLPRHNTADQLQSTTTFLGTTRPRLNSNTPIQLRTTISASERHGYTPTKALSSSQRLELHLATAESDTDLDLCPISTLPSRGSDTVIDYLKLLPDDAPICSASRDYLQPVFCKHPDCQGSCQGD
ncbi:uncharacterized protein [Littorina saxatilis]|uniref:Ig-like domain-containing protein n=1 Tax=Littorina saxatilis TaxID=31220 RepID=A0AAN9AKP3_9CAEN